MKKYLNWNNLFFAVIVLFILVQQGPIVVHNFKQAGQLLKQRQVDVFWPSDREIKFPPQNQNSLVIFWSSTCAPCKLEMSRLKSSVESGKVASEDIFAVNLFEGLETSRRFLQKNHYPFTFIHAPELVKELGVRVTPTTVFLDGGEVLKMSSGISITGIWSAESFLSN